MSDEVWKRDEVDSPCVKICMIHPEEQICVGCFRTLAEIAGWTGFTPEERQRLMADLPSRATRLCQRRGGRAGRGLPRAEGRSRLDG